MPHGTLKKYFVCFMYQSVWCFKSKKRKSEFHQLKEFLTQRWTMTLNFIIHKIVVNSNGFQCTMSVSCPGPDGFQNIMKSVSYSFPHGLIERRVIIKWLYRLYCIVSQKIQCTNGKLTYILVNKMGTTLTEEYGTTTTAAITNLLYLEGYSLCLTF